LRSGSESCSGKHNPKEEWPLLATLDETSRQHLCEAICTALEATASPVQVIKAKPDALSLVVKVDEDLSVDSVADLVEVAARSITAGGENAQGPPL
jgi:hypothetical protein